MRKYYDTHLNTIPLFGINILPHVETSELPLDNVQHITLSKLPPWNLHIPIVLFDIHNQTKSKHNTNELIYQTLFYEIRNKYPDYIPLYTYGSKMEERVAAAVYFPPDIFSA